MAGGGGKKGVGEYPCITQGPLQTCTVQPCVAVPLRIPCYIHLLCDFAAVHVMLESSTSNCEVSTQEPPVRTAKPQLPGARGEGFTMSLCRTMFFPKC